MIFKHIKIRFINALVLVIISTLILVGCTARAPESVPKGRIVFDSDRDHPLRGSDIYIMDATGDDIRRLTDDEDSNRSPAISPDGSQIAYISYQEGYEIIVMKSDGSKPMALYAGDEFIISLKWSPDGKWIAFGMSGKMLLLQPGKDGVSTLVDVSPAFVGGLAWSPDSARIAFSSTMDDESNFYDDIYIVRVDDGGVERITYTPYIEYVEGWSLDGEWLLIQTDQEAVAPLVSTHIYLLNLETKVSTPLIDSNASYRGDKEYNAAWSADGKWIVSTVHGGMGFGHGILALGADSDRVVDLKIGGCRPCLSDDGKKITWSRDDHTICVADLDLTSSTPVVSNVKVIDHRKKAHLYHPDFSPDGKYVTYSIGPGGRVLANGPGTHTQVAEMIGVRGKWDVYLRRTSGEGPVIRLTDDESLSNKEPEWIRGEPKESK